MLEFLKNHYGKILTGTSGTIIFTLAGFWVSDMRYASSKDIEEVKQEVINIKNELNELKQK